MKIKATYKREGLDCHLSEGWEVPDYPHRTETIEVDTGGAVVETYKTTAYYKEYSKPKRTLLWREYPFSKVEVQEVTVYRVYTADGVKEYIEDVINIEG